jgi:hypothetical protein
MDNMGVMFGCHALFVKRAREARGNPRFRVKPSPGGWNASPRRPGSKSRRFGERSPPGQGPAGPADVSTYQGKTRIAVEMALQDAGKVVLVLER